MTSLRSPQPMNGRLGVVGSGDRPAQSPSTANFCIQCGGRLQEVEPPGLVVEYWSGALTIFACFCAGCHASFEVILGVGTRVTAMAG